MNAVLEKIEKIGIVPVVVLNAAKDAEPLAKALCNGGLPCAEVTFRTEAAEESIRIMTEKFPEMLVHCHRTKGTITGMAVGAKNHFTAAGKHFAGKLVNDCLMRWYIDSTVFLCTGKTKYMIVFIDGSPYCT